MRTKAEAYNDLAVISLSLYLGTTLVGAFMVWARLSSPEQAAAQIPASSPAPLDLVTQIFPFETPTPHSDLSVDTSTAQTPTEAFTAVSTATPSPTTATPFIETATPTPEAIPFSLGFIDLREDLEILFPDGAVVQVHPLPNLKPNGIDDALISAFQDHLKTDEPSRRSLLMLKTDLPGVSWAFGHSGTIGGVPLPWNWLARAQFSELMANPPNLQLTQGATENMRLLYVTEVDWQITSPGANPDHFGQEEGGAFVRTDQMGIPNEVLAALEQLGGLIVVTCDGKYISAAESNIGQAHYEKQTIAVWIRTEVSTDR